MTNTEGLDARPTVDAVVIGAGAGGIYAVNRLTALGLSVQGFEGAADVGGVWFHNRYPGARVDVESTFYCYFEDEIYRDWTWTERYPAQPEILAYLNFAADVWNVRPHIRFNTWVRGARWVPEHDWYEIAFGDNEVVTARFLVMTGGQLSKSRDPQFAGLEDFEGEWVQTSHWPDREVSFAGKRVAVIGTGSSGVQTVPAIAREADHVYVFQRTPNYSVPAQNGPIDTEKHTRAAENVGEAWLRVLQHPAGSDIPLGAGPGHNFSTEEQQKLLDERWAYGGHTMNAVFSDQGADPEINDVVANFVRGKVEGIVDDPAVAKKLLPVHYPIGTRRLCVDIGYYEAFNRENVELVDIGDDPIKRLTQQGIQTVSGEEFQVDLIVFALGFEAFTGAIDAANITNEKGERHRDLWARGPRTYLGLMSAGFPNFFTVTGPGSPSVLANMIVANKQHIDFVAGMVAHMGELGATRVQPTIAAQDGWTDKVAEAASGLIRLSVQNYMVHVNEDDGSRVFIPWAAGLDSYVEICDSVVRDGYSGFEFS